MVSNYIVDIILIAHGYTPVNKIVCKRGLFGLLLICILLQIMFDFDEVSYSTTRERHVLGSWNIGEVQAIFHLDH